MGGGFAHNVDMLRFSVSFDAWRRLPRHRRDRSEIAKLLMDVWIEEDPYRSLEDPETLLQAEIERSLNEPSLGVVAVDEGRICAVVLIGTDDAGAAAGAPMLMWLTVRRDARDRGLATALGGHAPLG
jgi:predicted N-acetyltransferase YhbS